MKEGFQQAGEVCGNCKERWLEAKKKPMVLINLPNVTQVYHSKVAVCPYCDGPIHEIAVAAKRSHGDEQDA